MANASAGARGCCAFCGHARVIYSTQTALGQERAYSEIEWVSHQVVACRKTSSLIADIACDHRCKNHTYLGPKELEFFQASAFREFPPGLPDKPILYPVMNVDYAIQIALV